VHEAFAAPVVNDPKPGPVVPKEPPAPVEEMPPDQKPAGANVQWISGYWSWDQERKDYIWVSGIWREPPPGRQWIPGYWHRVDGGFQWVPGTWAPVPSGNAGAEQQGQAAASYLPAPPANLEAGPNTPRPSGDVFWSPGSWYWQEGRYVWRPGFWAAVQPTWVWVPPHYVWTPGGYLFVEGYWDMPLASRGMLFAPVYYAQPVYLRPSYVLTPSITIGTGGLMANLFVQPSYYHYYFGNYYAQSYVNVGILPWFSFAYSSGPARPVFYDPLFTFYAAVNVRRDPGWVTRVRREYVLRRENVALRPPRTYIEQTRIIERNVNITRQTNVIMGRPIHQLAAHPEAAGGLRLERVNAQARQQWQERGVALRQFREERIRQEAQAPGGRPGWRAEGHGPAMARGAERPRPMNLAGSPVAAPIHAHGPARGSHGPAEHRDRGALARGGSVLTGPRHEPIAGREGAGRAGPGPASPAIRHERRPLGPESEHLPRPGQAAPHDRSRIPGATGEAPRMTPGRGLGPDPSRLHAPPQYTHRQPPPPPRPAPRERKHPGR
jgi:hypothetical protein